MRQRGVREVDGTLLARNSLINLVALAVPLVAGVVAVPFIVRGLGTARFGILALAWAVAGYFTVLDLGLGRATTKFVAEALGRREPDTIPPLVWTAVAVQSVIGVAGGVLLALLTPALVDRILNVPAALEGEARRVFVLLAVTVPFTLVSASFRGVVEAAQRFDLVNAVRVPMSLANYLVPLVGVLAGWSLPAIVLVLAVVQVLTTIAYLAGAVRLFPPLRRPTLRGVPLRTLVSYGGWITVPTLVGPVFAYLDRLVVGILVSLTAVAYYAAPYEVLSRLWFIPAAVLGTLFPALSRLGGEGRQRGGHRFAGRSLEYLLIGMGPVFILMAAYARDILGWWLGPAFAEHSAPILQVLALAFLLYNLAYVPFTALQALGRADVAAKIHLLELPVYVGVLWGLVVLWGAFGAAVAWAIRCALDAALMFGAALRLPQADRDLFPVARLRRGALVLLVFAAVTGASSALLAGPWARFLAAGVAVAALAAWVWRRLLSETERSWVAGLLRPAGAR